MFADFMGQEFRQDSAGLAYLCSTMSEALSGETKRDRSDSIWPGVGIIYRLLRLSGTWTGVT